MQGREEEYWMQSVGAGMEESRRYLRGRDSLSGSYAIDLTSETQNMTNKTDSQKYVHSCRSGGTPAWDEAAYLGGPDFCPGSQVLLPGT